MRVWLLWATIAVLAGCSDGSEPNPGTCPQTYEFGNFGCARVQGFVRDQKGSPVAGAYVMLVPAPDVDNSFNTPVRQSNADGSFALEIHDFGGPSTHQARDTASFYLRASLSQGADLPVISDSVLINLKFSPVGEMPQVADANITLQVPQ